ncbi:hypothetical protein ACFSUD_12220 [Sulfitobacter aestuarii]|uniref:Uncharacterized protein n=1 Tax=Sulfitobacter aestuarii TaxID=2161676 RepID=A0ABW5U353_9RHOB
MRLPSLPFLSGGDLGQRHKGRVIELLGESGQPVGQGKGLEIAENVQNPVISHP